MPVSTIYLGGGGVKTNDSWANG